VLRILITDDHAVVRRGLKQILEEEFNKVVFGEAQNTREMLEHLQKEHWDVLILDITLPGRSGLELLGELKLTHPNLPVLVLSMHPEDQYGIRVLKSGASGYMTKESAPDEIVVAIRKILRGGKYVSPALAERLVSNLEVDREKPLHEALSDREYEVMVMICAGKILKEIAQKLDLSIKTVSTYRSRILKKMKMENNAELIRYAIKNQLVD
jgi:two-component system invasion response regulator UvrY